MIPSKAETNKTQRVRIELYASKLKNVAGAFKGISDPYAVVTILPNFSKTEKPEILGFTEVIKNCLSPRWTTFFDLDYSMGETKRFNVGVYDETRKAKSNKPMGSATFEIGEILGSRGNVKATKLREGGVVFARVTAAPPKLHGLLRLSLRGVHLKNVEGLFGGRSDPFLEISSRVVSPGLFTWQTVYRGKPVMNDLNPVWPEFTLDIGRLCHGNQEQPVLFEVFDWEKSGKHKRMGQFQTTVRALLQAETPSAAGAELASVDDSRAFHLRLPRREQEERGKVVVTRAYIEKDADVSQATPSEAYSSRGSSAADMPTPTPVMPIPVPPIPAPVPPIPVPVRSSVSKPNRPTFIDYLAGGCELELSIAIDFTGSNGDPRKPGTLHYVHKDGVTLNDYEKAFTSVGAIIGKFDSNNRFPVWGFGAKFGGVVNHCFQVGDAPELKGIGEALNAYRRVFERSITMSGPTVYATCIDMAAERARLGQERAEQIGQQTYSILLILTDGSVKDIESTKQSLRNASDAPLSIVIVGVGSADFSNLRLLDNFADGESNQRDIIKFVEFNKFAHDRSALTRETLDEIPGQLVEYFFDHRRIPPLPSLRASQLDIEGDEAGSGDFDLCVEYGSNGDIVLGNTESLPVYDETQYSKATTFLTPSVPASLAPYYKEKQPPHSETQSSWKTPHMPVPASLAPYYKENQPSHSETQSSWQTPHSFMSYGVPSYATSASTSQGGSLANSRPPAPPPFEPHLADPKPRLSDTGPHRTNPKQRRSGFCHALSEQSVGNDDIFLVQVPPGVFPGEALEVQNPRTQQYLVVAVPPGVLPGGKFAVAY